MRTVEVPKEKKERLLRWVKALESGRYKQGRFMLKSADNEYCCLGVACNVAKQDLKLRWETKLYRGSLGIIGKDVTYKTAALPPRVRKWLGISTAFEEKLMTMNDSHNLTFKEIAAVIRKKYNLGEKK